MTDTLEVKSITRGGLSTPRVISTVAGNIMRLFQKETSFRIPHKEGALIFVNQKDADRQILTQTIPALLGFENKVEGYGKNYNIEFILADFQKKLKQSIEEYYSESGLKQEVQKLIQENQGRTTLDMILCEHIYQKSKQGIHDARSTVFPNTRDSNDFGFNCMFGSIMLHLALQQAGYSNIHNTTIQGPHHIISRVLEDGKIRIYDFYEYDDSDKSFVQDCDYQKKAGANGGFFFQTIMKDYPGLEKFTTSSGTNNSMQCYAYPSDTIADINIYMHDIAEIKDYVDDPTHMGIMSRNLILKIPMLEHFDYNSLESRYGLFTPYKLLDLYQKLENLKN